MNEYAGTKEQGIITMVTDARIALTKTQSSSGRLGEAEGLVLCCYAKSEMISSQSGARSDQSDDNSFPRGTSYLQ